MGWSYTTEVPYAITKRRIHLDLQSVSYHGKSIPLGAIEIVKMRVTKQSVNGIPTTTNYQFELGSSQVPGLRLIWGCSSLQSKATKARCEEAYQTLLNLLDGEVRDRVLRTQFARPLPTTFGPLTIGPEQISGRALLKTVQVPWSAVLGTDMAGGVQSVVYVNEKGAQAKMGAMDLWQDNALWLPQIIRGYRDWFLGWQQGN